MLNHTSYLKQVVPTTERKKTVNKAVRRLRKMLKDGEIEFDAIAFMGMSGALVAPTIAARLDKEIIMVRKGGVDPPTHSKHEVEGNHHSDTPIKYVVVDDIIFSGNTMKYMLNAIGPEHKCVGHYLYRHSMYYACPEDSAKWGKNLSPV